MSGGGGPAGRCPQRVDGTDQGRISPAMARGGYTLGSDEIEQVMKHHLEEIGDLDLRWF